jgi:NADH-quinone oxidoreductase subunit H
MPNRLEYLGSTITALTAFAVIPFSEKIRVAVVNVGLLIISAMSAVGILGIILGGWSSNSHYSLLGALRSSAQLVSYEVALGLALVSGVMMAGTLSMTSIVKAQQSRHIWFVFENFGLMIVPFVVYLISATAETNRAPFDLPEAESELVAGFHTEYSGFRWALYFLAEYANIFVVSSVAVALFWGGWLRPFPNVAWLEIPLNYGLPLLVFAGTGAASTILIKKLKDRSQQIVLAVVCAGMILIGLACLIPVINAAIIDVFWFLAKVSVFVYIMIWFRGTFPRFRYDQLMNIGWKYMIPIGMGAILVNAIVGMLKS